MNSTLKKKKPSIKWLIKICFCKIENIILHIYNEFAKKHYEKL